MIENLKSRAPELQKKRSFLSKISEVRKGGRKFAWTYIHLSNLFLYENRKQDSQVCFFALPL